MNGFSKVIWPLKKMLEYTRVTSCRARQRGFTLIISVLISSILLSIGIAIYNVSIKETILSSAGKESQNAFYAADTAMECFNYWDYPVTLPGTGFFDAVVAPGSISCGGVDLVVVSSACPGGNCSHTLEYNFGNESDECATLVIQKNGTTGATSVQARGYNTCNDEDPRKTERGIQIN